VRSPSGEKRGGRIPLSKNLVEKGGVLPSRQGGRKKGGGLHLSKRKGESSIPHFLMLTDVSGDNGMGGGKKEKGYKKVLRLKTAEVIEEHS